MASDVGAGQQTPSDSAGAYNSAIFIIQQELAKISTVKLVQVLAVDTTAKTVDVQPMVNQIDGDNNATPHGTILGVSYGAWQFGPNAVIADPAVGDKGIMICSDRDISTVKASKDISPPGTNRLLDAADGMYIGGVPLLNSDPTQWVKFLSDGLQLHDVNNHELVSGPSGWAFTGVVTFNDNVQFAGQLLGGTGAEMTADIKTTGIIQSGTIILGTHKHLGVTTGAGTSGGPTP